MKSISLMPALCALVLASAAAAQVPSPIANPAIDMQGYLNVSSAAAAHREARRLSETDFLRMSREPGTIVLDARSRENYDQLHVVGALNLSFSDIAVDSLRRTIPDLATRILIYCNNNFGNAEGPFPDQDAECIAQLVDLHCALHVRLPQYLRAGAAGGPFAIDASIRVDTGESTDEIMIRQLAAIIRKSPGCTRPVKRRCHAHLVSPGSHSEIAGI
jgi:hypothetical protein